MNELKVCQTGDLHLDENSRFEETLAIMKWMRSDMFEFKPHVILIGGDSAPVSVRRMTPLERNHLAEWYISLAEIAEVVVIPGNHDGDSEDVRIFQALRSPYFIHVADRPKGILGPNKIYGSESFRVFCIPWPSKGYLMESIKGQAVEEVGQACRDAFRMILMGAKADFAQFPDAFHIILGHLNVGGADVGGFTLIGQDVEVAAEDLIATGADLVCLSHIHKEQSWYGKIHYPGSPRYIDFGEEGETKGYKRYTLQKGKEPVVEFRPTQGLTALQTIQVAYTSGFWSESAYCWPGAEVRVIVACDEEQRATIDEKQLLMQLNGDKAKSVRFEWRVRPVERVRAPAMKEARSDADRLIAYLGTLQPVPDSAIVERLLLKLSIIESDGRA